MLYIHVHVPTLCVWMLCVDRRVHTTVKERLSDSDKLLNVIKAMHVHVCVSSVMITMAAITVRLFLMTAIPTSLFINFVLNTCT